MGVWAADAMFELPLWQVSVTVRTGPGQWFAEFVATFGLVLTILACLARTPAAIPYAVGLYITAAYWFTACGFRALRDHLCFVLGDGRQNVNREAVGLREIDGVKLHPGLHQVRYERHVPGKPIKLRDDQGGAVKAAELEGFGELRPSLRLPLSTSVISATKRQSPPLRKSPTQFAAPPNRGQNGPGGVACFANALIEVVDLLVRVALVDGRKLTNETRPAHSAR
jgi:hypothetical protein